MLRLALVPIAASVAGVSFAAEKTADQLIHQVEQRYNNARTLKVNFEEVFAADGRSRPAETGVLTLEKKGKMRWDYSQPPGKLFLVDGKEVYLYTARDNRVEKMPLKSTEDMRAPLAFLLGRLDLKKEFRNFEVASDPGGEWLLGSAKSDRVPYESMAMLIRANGSIADLRIRARDGSEMRFRFDGEVMNPRLEANLFHFEIPAGAEVVNGVEFQPEGK